MQKNPIDQFLGRSCPSYDAAGTGRRLSGWRPPNSGPRDAVAPSLQLLRARSRDAVRNSPIAASAVKNLVSSLVGTGIVPRPNTMDAALKEKLTSLWAAWVRTADADGVLDFYGLQALVVRSWLESGECFVRIRPRRLQDGFPVPMQLQVLEADMVPTLDADTWPGLPAGNIIRQGIELDRVGKRAAFWMYRSHPGDRPPPNINPSEVVRVPAESVLHVFEPQRPGQLRGAPIMSAALTKMRLLDDFDDAVVERQRLANLFALFIVKPLPSNADAMTGQPFKGDPNAPMATLEPGIAQELLPGEDVKFSEPPGAGADYEAFLRRQNLMIAAGIGLPYELLTGDVKDVSDRSLRLTVLEYRRWAESKIWGVIVPAFLSPIRDGWAIFARMGGALDNDDAQNAASSGQTTWAVPAWAAIHPLQDLQTRKLEVESGFRSRSSVIAERGDDPDQVDAERAADAARAADLGLASAADLSAEKMQAEIDAQRAASEAAQAAAAASQAQKTEATTSARMLAARERQIEAIASIDLTAARDRAKVAALEVQAAQLGLDELRGG